MTPEQVHELSSPFLQQGLLGTVCVVLAYLAWFFYRSREADRKGWELKEESYRKRIEELYEKRISEKEAITTLAISTERTLEMYSRSVNARTPA